MIIYNIITKFYDNRMLSDDSRVHSCLHSSYYNPSYAKKVMRKLIGNGIISEDELSGVKTDKMGNTIGWEIQESCLHKNSEVDDLLKTMP